MRLPARHRRDARRETHFRGLGIAVAAAPLYALLFHTAYVLSGTSTLGSLVASCVGVPAECAKHRVQLGASVRDAIRGGRSLYDGYIATLARNVPYNAVNFTAFFALNSILPAPLAGLLAGLLTALATHPLDLVTARVQTARLSSAQPPPTNMLRTLDDARTTNILFRGLTYRLFAFPPASALFFAIFHPTRTAVLGAFPQ
ncbi:hypothetical protein CTAYLR_005076 [Chrysophaeum taylorii]|uniref:Uncharacterized protein n=1 Tax=Chrysophaeum taylorii TaxID=2483200 RepID=A0AAD7U9S8_9STRA|nr:hypothetical protein CTAYLR_005076 [Chrysophaeum taylorii]